MKTITRLFIAILIVYGLSSKAQNPIPSYNIAVYYVANFQEASKSPLGKSLWEGKKTIYVTVNGGANQPSCQATVWVYSIDQQDVYGPFTVSCGETISQEIDEREWGVLVQSDVHVYVDVWIDDGTPLKGGVGDGLEAGQKLPDQQSGTGTEKSTLPNRGLMLLMNDK